MKEHVSSGEWQQEDPENISWEVISYVHHSHQEGVALS